MAKAKILLYDFPGSICSQMARLALAEKGVAHDRQIVDIMEAAEQFEPWYTALNPRAVVPTLKIGDEIVTDTIRIVQRIDSDCDGPPLTPDDEASAEAMERMMRDIMALHYGVLLYSRRLEADGSAPTVAARGKFLRRQLELHPERAELLERRIAGNENLLKILADREETARHVDDAKVLVGRIDEALSRHEFVSAGHYTLADTFATAALARFRLHGFHTWWSGGENAHVADYYRRMQARPSWQAAGIIDQGSERDL
jgi:glutathione S-transferase